MTSEQAQRGVAAAPDEDGRFRPGCAGDPGGGAKGTRARLRGLAPGEGDSGTVGRVVLDGAKDGGKGLAKFVFPRPRGRALPVRLPTGHTPADLIAGWDILLEAANDGLLTMEEAAHHGRVLDRRAAAF